MWSQDMRTITSTYEAVEHGLRHFAGICYCAEAGFGTINPSQLSKDFVSTGSFHHGEFLSGEDLSAERGFSPNSGLKSLPELIHLSGLRASQQGDSIDQLGLFGDQRLSISEESPLEFAIFPVSCQHGLSVSASDMSLTVLWIPARCLCIVS